MSARWQRVKLSPPSHARDTIISTESPQVTDAQNKLSERLDEVESRLVFQEDLLNTLNDVIAAQDMRMTELIRQIDVMEQQLKQGSDLAGFAGGGDGMAEEPPPHY